MVQEVNKLIYNTLILHGGIILPGVGSLVLRRNAARFDGKNRVVPPTYSVEFSSVAEAVSLIDEIVKVANVDRAMAEDIYGRWLDKVKHDAIICIDGVGEIRNKSFVADKQLLLQINGDNTKPMTMTRRRRRGRAVVIIILILALCCGALYYIWLSNNEAVVRVDEDDINIEITSDDKHQGVEEEVIIDIAIGEEEHDNEGDILAVTEESSLDDWTSNPDIRHWLVVGTYSTMENAQRAKRDNEEEHADHVFDIYPLGEMYAVVVYGSSTLEECEAFKRAVSNEFSHVWIHTPRRFR